MSARAQRRWSCNASPSRTATLHDGLSKLLPWNLRLRLVSFIVQSSARDGNSGLSRAALIPMCMSTLSCSVKTQFICLRNCAATRNPCFARAPRESVLMAQVRYTFLILFGDDSPPLLNENLRKSRTESIKVYIRRSFVLFAIPASSWGIYISYLSILKHSSYTNPFISGVTGLTTIVKIMRNMSAIVAAQEGTRLHTVLEMPTTSLIIDFSNLSVLNGIWESSSYILRAFTIVFFLSYGFHWRYCVVTGTASSQSSGLYQHIPLSNTHLYFTK